MFLNCQIPHKSNVAFLTKFTSAICTGRYAAPHETEPATNMLLLAEYITYRGHN